MELTQQAVDNEIIEESDSLKNFKFKDELDFRELEQIPQVMVKLTEGQVLEEFMLEEETDFQDIDKCTNIY